MTVSKNTLTSIRTFTLTLPLTVEVEKNRSEKKLKKKISEITITNKILSHDRFEPQATYLQPFEFQAETADIFSRLFTFETARWPFQMARLQLETRVFIEVQSRLLLWA